jgi:hypothetical protein
MPIKSMKDVDNMIAAYKESQQSRPKSHSDRATGYWVDTQAPINEGYYSRSISSSSSPSSPTTSPSFLSRVVRVFGIGDMLDENGYYNSSRQVMK